MMKNNNLRSCILLLFCFALTWHSALATSLNNDPEAKKILDKLKKEYDSYKSLEMDFLLTLDLPGEPAQLQKGNVIQSGEKYKLVLDQQAIYSDGSTMWVHLISNNEVQINDVELEGSEFMSPKDLLAIYESGEYEYQMIKNQMLGTKKVHEIEFKPTSPNSEYTKMRLSVDTKDRKIEQLMIFSRDGSQYTLDIKKIIPNRTYKDSEFVFDSSQYEDLYIEDLRID